MKLTPRAILNLGLLIAAGSLGLLVVLQPGKQPPPKQTVSSIDKKTITHIQIHRDKQDDVILEKRGSDWYMTAPYQYPANDYKVESLLQLPGATSIAHYDLAQMDLSKYGLDKPRGSITFNHDQTFYFGSSEPMQARRYLRFQNTLHLITDLFMYQIAVTPNSFLDHAIVPGNKTFTKLEIPKLTAELKDSKWTLTPAPKDYTSDQITALLDGWRYAQAIAVDHYDGKPAPVTVRIYRSGEPKPMEFASRVTDKDLILIRNDLKLQFTLSLDKRKDLLALPPRIDVPEKATDKISDKPSPSTEK